MEAADLVIREATPSDGPELQELQSRCPQGTDLVVSTVNRPDFFARAKVYECSRVYVACRQGRIVGSAALAVRPAVVAGSVLPVAHVFQGFVEPDQRRQGVAEGLLRHIGREARERGAVLSYGLVMEGNQASLGLVEKLGFRCHRDLQLAILPASDGEEEARGECVRPLSREDLPAVAELIGHTWGSRELYEPVSAESLAPRFERTPALDLDDAFVLEAQGRILACVGYWDWSRITQVTVLHLNPRLREAAAPAREPDRGRAVPSVPSPGETLRQVMLTPVAFRTQEALATLLRRVGRHAFARGARHLFCVCEPKDPLGEVVRALTPIGSALHLVVQPGQTSLPRDRPVAIDGIDL